MDDLDLKYSNSEEISPNDKILIAQLRDRLKGELTQFYDTDFNILRWLIGHDRDLDKIEKLLRNHLRVRKAIGLDCSIEELEAKMNPIVKQYFPKIILRNPPDHVANVIIEVLLDGWCDIEGLFYSVSSSDILITKLCGAEISLRGVMEMEAQTGKRHAVFIIDDSAGAKYDSWFWKAVRESYFSISMLLATHYVEVMEKIVYINTNRFATAVWKIAQPFLPRKSLEKVEILGKDWKNGMEKYLSPEQMPLCLGGSNDVVIGEKINEINSEVLRIPKSLYYDKSTDETVLNVSDLSLPRSSTRTITKHLKPTDVPCDIAWVFRTKIGICFGVYFTDTELQDELATTPIHEKLHYNDYSTMYPLLHLFVNAKPESGCIKAETPGYYHFQFQNQSWLFSSTVQYKIEQR